MVVHIDKSSQRMMVAVDGRPRLCVGGLNWPRQLRDADRPLPPEAYTARSWFSTRYYGSPMPYSIFFHKGYAIYGTYHISRLGGPASHGCVRLHPGNAATLFMLVRRYGMANTTIAISGATPGVYGKRRARYAHGY